MKQFIKNKNSYLYCSRIILTLLLFALALTGCGGGGGSANGDESDLQAISPSSGPYSVAGQVSVQNYIVFDSDTADPAAPSISNDSLTSAQPLDSSAVVSGYVDADDELDCFSVSLRAAQTVRLTFADSSVADLDLTVYDSAGQIYDVSAGNGDSETLTVAVAGNYYIEVSARLGGSIYLLDVSSRIDQAGADQIHLSDDYVPGELIVTYKAASVASETADFSPGSGNGRRAGEHRGSRLYRFSSRWQHQQLRRQLGMPQHEATDDDRRHTTARRERKWQTLQLVKELRRQDHIATVDLNYQRRASGLVPDDNFYLHQQWYSEMINMPQAWQLISADSSDSQSDIVVAVIDSGVLPYHPDLQGRLTSDGIDFVSDRSSAADGDGIDSDPTDPDNSNAFHGTHVAGIIAATTDNAMGVAGFSWNRCKVMPLRVLGSDGGTSYDLIQAVRYAAGLSNASGMLPDKRADIINLSLGGYGYSQTERNLFSEVAAQGIIVVAAAGNHDSGSAYYPASYADVITVAAVDSTGERAYYSNYGATIDVAAPGGTPELGIWSSVGIELSGAELVYSYGRMYGTSVATPQVAAVAALMKERVVDLRSCDFRDLLRSGLLTQTATGHSDDLGYGLIDAEKALSWALSNGTVPSSLVVDCPSIGLDALDRSAVVTISASDVLAQGPIRLVSDADWLAVTAVEVDCYGLGSYRLTADVSDLPLADYQAEILVRSGLAGIEDVIISVQLQLLVSPDWVDGGYHHIRLIDPLTQRVVYETAGVLDNGVLNYRFDSVSAGDYQLLAGTDHDQDGIIFEIGESAGSYSDGTADGTLSVSYDLSGIDFSVALQTD